MKTALHLLVFLCQDRFQLHPSLFTDQLLGNLILVPGCDKEAQSLKMSAFVRALEKCLDLRVVLKKFVSPTYTKPLATPTLTAAQRNSLDVGLLQK